MIIDVDFAPFKIPFLKPFTFAGTTLRERSGFYLTLKTAEALCVRGEVAPLEGVSQETIRRTKHDLKETCSYLREFKVPCQKDKLLGLLKQDPHILNVCPSVRFGIESAMLMLAATACQQSLAEFLGAELKGVQTAALLQGTYQEVITDLKSLSGKGYKVFKLKVGDRNIALDVKKIKDIRIMLEQGTYMRLDGNQVWSLKEACIFAQLTGNQNIDFIEEPINDASQLDDFYQQTRMRLALDETLYGDPSLIEHEGVVAYILKPMILGLVPTLDWIEKARLLKRKAVISSAFESPVAFKVLANLACLSGQIAGLGTERWLKGIKPMVGDDGTIKKEHLR